MTAQSAPAAVTVSVLFLRRRAPADATLPQRGSPRDPLLATLRSALQGWDAGRRVVLEAPDGLVVVGDVAPSVALDAARHAAEAVGSSCAVGLHHGPVRAAPDAAGTARVVGDGVDTAAALAGFETGHAIVASQAFRDALSTESPRRAQELRAAGEQVDARLRSHALHVHDPVPARRRSRRFTLLGAVGLVALLAAGWGGRMAREAYEAAHRPAVILLDIRPAGELFVDGERKGSTPPLVRLTLPPGPHTIELRNGRFKPVHMEVQLRPGEEMQLRHVFAAPRRAQPRPQPRPEPGLFDRFKFW